MKIPQILSAHTTVGSLNCFPKGCRFIAASLQDAYIYRQGGLVLRKDEQQRHAWSLKLE